METERKGTGNKSLFNTESVIMGLLLSGMVWGGTQIVAIKGVQASNVAKQAENDRVNEIVYEAIPDIHNAVITIKSAQQYQSERMDGLFTVVSNMNHSINNPQTDEDVMTNTLILKYGKAPITQEK